MHAFIFLCLIGAACAAQLSYVGPSYLAPPVNSVPAYGGSVADPSYASHSYSAPAELEKEYYSFAADDADFEDPAATEQVANNLKKNLRVIFIKGPENRVLENAALALAKQAVEQQTAIYVLNKQPNIADLANKFNAVSGSSNRAPEVHFVKYRTPEDAANAQRSIQSQYDALGGSAKSHNGGIAPVLNFASRSPAPVASSSYGSIGAVNTNYLPASILRSLRLRV